MNNIMNKKAILLCAMLLTNVLPLGSQAAAASQTEKAPATEQFEQLDGGWTVTEGRTKLDKHTRKVFAKALEGLVGCDYDPVALLGRQVVAGTNYCILCRLTPVVPKAVPHWGLAYIYEDLQGNARLTAVKDLPLGE